MPTYKLTMFEEDNFSTDSSGDSLFQEVSFGSPANVNESFTFLGGGTSQRVRVNEGTGTANPNQLEENVSDQTLDEAVTVAGQTFAAGSLIVTGWRLTLQGSDGETYVMSSVSLGNRGNGNNPVFFMAFHDKKVPPDGTVLTVTEEVNGVAPNGIPYVCFTRGTWISTVAGPRLIETLRVGDLVLTADNGPQPLRWIGRRRYSALHVMLNREVQPVLMRAGTMGLETDLLVSPHHRMMLRGAEAEVMFGEREVLVAATHLETELGVQRVRPEGGVEYFHLAFDSHELVFANGALSESLYLGQTGLDGIGAGGRAELALLGLLRGPSERTRPFARPVLARHEGQFAARRAARAFRLG
ncbi:MAG: Hint domain-containing protein [Pseudomonadota bacterium]